MGNGVFRSSKSPEQTPISQTQLSNFSSDKALRETPQGLSQQQQQQQQYGSNYGSSNGNKANTYSADRPAPSPSHSAVDDVERMITELGLEEEGNGKSLISPADVNKNSHKKMATTGGGSKLIFSSASGQERIGTRDGGVKTLPSNTFSGSSSSTAMKKNLTPYSTSSSSHNNKLSSSTHTDPTSLPLYRHFATTSSNAPTVTLAEFSRAMEVLCGMGGVRVSVPHVFGLYDVDGDSVLNNEELRCAAAGLSSTDATVRVRALLLAFDADRDGCLTKEELGMAVWEHVSAALKTVEGVVDFARVEAEVFGEELTITALRQAVTTSQRGVGGGGGGGGAASYSFSLEGPNTNLCLKLQTPAGVASLNVGPSQLLASAPLVSVLGDLVVGSLVSSLIMAASKCGKAQSINAIPNVVDLSRAQANKAKVVRVIDLEHTLSETGFANWLAPLTVVTTNKGGGGGGGGGGGASDSSNSSNHNNSATTVSGGGEKARMVLDYGGSSSLETELDEFDEEDEEMYQHEAVTLARQTVARLGR